MSHNCFGELQFYNAKHHHRGQAHKDDRRRTNRTHRVGALPQSDPGLCGTLVGPSKDTHRAPVPPRREAVGGPQRDKLHTQYRNDKTKVTVPRLGYQQGSGAGLLKP